MKPDTLVHLARKYPDLAFSDLDYIEQLIVADIEPKKVDIVSIEGIHSSDLLLPYKHLKLMSGDTNTLVSHLKNKGFQTTRSAGCGCLLFIDTPELRSEVEQFIVTRVNKRQEVNRRYGVR